MSIVGVFSQARPEIGGLYFDALLEESSELASEVTAFPLENGAIGSDHVVLNPMVITMTVGTSDNVSRAASAAAGVPITGSAVGTVVGAAIGQLPGEVAAVVGIQQSVANAAATAGQSSTRSMVALDQIRVLQKIGAFVDVISSKGRSYTGCLIRNTRQATNKENELGLELIVELVQPLIRNTQRVNRGPRKATLPPLDPAETQAQPWVDLGEVSATT
ncbi:phage baseplate protein [Alloalcanivorax xenomutans]